MLLDDVLVAWLLLRGDCRDYILCDIAGVAGLGEAFGIFAEHFPHVPNCSCDHRDATCHVFEQLVGECIFRCVVFWLRHCRNVAAVYPRDHIVSSWQLLVDYSWLAYVYFLVNLPAEQQHWIRMLLPYLRERLNQGVGASFP